MSEIVITESRPSEILAALHSSAQAEREYLFSARDASTDDLILVGWDGEVAVGYIAVTDLRQDGLLIWEHVVVPDRRGEGLGQRLLLAAARRAVPRAPIEVDPLAELDLDRLADYYQQLGFFRDGSGQISGTAADVIQAVSRRSGASSEASMPVAELLARKAPGVVTISPDASIAEAASIMSERGIGAVVVSTDGRRIEGILSERDIVAGLAARPTEVAEATTAELATPDVVTCTDADPIAEVMDIMTNQRIRHLPVTVTGDLVGVISIGDLVNYRLTDMG